MQTDDYSEAELRDLVLALELLRGKAEADAAGLPRHKYIASGSDAEKSGREAIAWLLTNAKPLDGLLRATLASMFDTSRGKADREIRFVHIGRRSAENTRRAKIALDVLDDLRLHGKVEASVESVAKKLSISKSSVWGAWMQFKGQT